MLVAATAFFLVAVVAFFYGLITTYTEPLVGQAAITVGAAYMTFQYLLMLHEPIEQITQQLQELQKAAAGTGIRLTTKSLGARAEAWRPWRAYAVIHLWKEAMTP